MASEKTSHKNNARLPLFARNFLIFALLGVLVLFFWVIFPLFSTLIYAALIAVFFYPLHRLMVKVCLKQKTAAAFLTTLLVMALFLIPLTIFGIFLAQEAYDYYLYLTDRLADVDFRTIDFRELESIPLIGQPLQAWAEKAGLEQYLQEITTSIYDYLQNLKIEPSFIVEQGATVVQVVSMFFLNLFILLLSVFFFFRDGDRIRNFLKSISPLPKRHDDEIEQKLKATTHGIVVGNFGTAMLQGAVGAIGFAIAGIDHVVLLGTVMAFTSLIPYIGAAAVWVPVAIYMFIQGDITWGLFITGWGALIVSLIDNFTRPFLIGGSARMHPLPTFLVVLGGILVFGLKGIIFGPLILSLVITIIHIYQLEYETILEQ